jgi:diadenosine tetraphosphatase ApaH/serine/threonine PP2A family protein phosphatase
MRIAVVSDVHANLEGLRAVLGHAERGGALDGVWCLGDLVGYGPDPGAVIAELRSRALTAVCGNHDGAAADLMDVEEFNPAAASAALWTRGRLTAAERAYLAHLPHTVVLGDFTLTHGSLRDPVWEYLLSPEQAAAHFALQKTLYGLVGHSHFTFWAEEEPGRGPVFRRAEDGTTLALGGRRLILKPGSCGQPRDGDPRAAYLLYDRDAATVTWHRVEYDIAATQAKMRGAGLHPWLIERLAMGE